jgi:hypothetical protein
VAKLTGDRRRVTIPLSDSEKALDAAWRALPLLPAETRGEIAALLTLQSMAMIGATAAVWAGSHFFGVGFVFDVVALGVGSYCLGSEALRAGHELYRFWTRATRAKTEADLDAAAGYFAHAISIIGVNTILIIFARRIGKAGASARAMARLSMLLDQLEFGRIRNGALWAKLDGDVIAMNFAEKDGRVTLGKWLEQSGYLEVIESETKGRDWEKFGRPFWKRLSLKFAAALEGDVVAYVENPVLEREIAKIDLDGKHGSILPDELLEITELMETNSQLRSVTIKNVRGKTLTTVHGAKNILLRSLVEKSSRSTQ